MAAGTLGYASRKTIGRWLAGGDVQPETQECMRQKAQEVRQLEGYLTLTELDRKHSELIEKLFPGQYRRAGRDALPDEGREDRGGRPAQGPSGTARHPAH